MNKTKSYNNKRRRAPGARVHMAVSVARENGLPKLLGTLAAIIAPVIMGIWSYLKIGTPQIGALIIFFIIFMPLFRLLSRFTFFCIDMFTRPSYNAFMRREASTNSEREHRDTYYRSLDDDVVFRDDTVAAAKEMFGVGDAYTSEELKAIYYYKLQHEKIHPDNGGDSKTFIKFKQAYATLKQHVADKAGRPHWPKGEKGKL